MHSLMCALAAYAVNAGWELPLLAGAGWLAAQFVRRCGPNAEHRVWRGVSMLGIASPFLPLLDSLLTSRTLGGAGGVDISIGVKLMPDVLAPRNGSLALPEWAIGTVCVLYGSSLLYGAARLTWLLVKTAGIVRSSKAIVLSTEMDECWRRATSAFAPANVTLRRSNQVRGIAATGWSRPTILISSNFLERCTKEDFLSAMGHELAHLERRDPAKNVISAAASLLVAFHPVSWIIRAKIARTREMICDAMAVDRLVEARVYRQSLLRLAQQMTQLSTAGAAALGIFEGNALEERMMRIRKKRAAVRGSVRAGLVISSILVLGFTAASCMLARGIVADHDPSLGKVYHPGADVTNPKLVYAPDAEYPSGEKAATTVEVQSVVSVIVDQHGAPQDVHIVRSGGAAFDESAMVAVRKYRFEPGKHAGKSVAVAIHIEVNFKKY
jgi:TonB family protein